MALPLIDNSPTDERSELKENIPSLLPEVQILARSLVHAAAQLGITIKVISGSRTYEHQHCLYLQGRKPGEVNPARKKEGLDPIPEEETKKKVTNADAGFSNHNFQIAFDIGVFEGKKYLGESPLYKAVAVLGKQLGLSWGGDWKTSKDEPHYELRPHWAKDLDETAMVTELRKRKAANQGVFD